jgi:hypothetical protein
VTSQRFHFRPQTAARRVAAGAGILAIGYGIYAGISRSRFGRVKSTTSDKLLDRFMPDYDVVDSHYIEVAAPAETTLAAAASMDLLQAPRHTVDFQGTRIHDGRHAAVPKAGSIAD